MVDTVDKATRSRMMAAVRGRDTGPELALRRLLWENGLRGYRVHRRDVSGRPDVAWLGRKVAVFVDGSFWHGHPRAYTPGKSGEYWDIKIQGNMQRDARVDHELTQDGWCVVRVWDFEVSENPQETFRRIAEAVRARDPRLG